MLTQARIELGRPFLVLAGLFAESVRLAHPLVGVAFRLRNPPVSLGALAPSPRRMLFRGRALGFGMRRVVS